MENTQRPTVCTVLGVLSIIGAVFGVFWVVFLGGLSVVFGIFGGAGVSIGLIGLTLLMILGVALSIGIAVWFFGMKSWLPVLVFVSLGVNILQYIMNALSEWGSFSSGLIGLAISAAIVWYVQMNKDLFKN